MKQLAEYAVGKMKGRVDYGDIRIVDTKYESITVKNGIIEGVKRTRSYGFGIRLLKDEGWGFSSSSRIGESEIERVINDALAIAAASRLPGVKIRLAPVSPVRDNYQTRYLIDPFEIRIDDKIKFLCRVNSILSRKWVDIALTSVSFIREHKIFASTEGSLIEQLLLASGGSIKVITKSDWDLQVRSYQNSGQAGYEFIERLDLEGNGERIGEELQMLLKAKPCPAQKTVVILDQDQMALQIHESIGHATELDRVLGMEASYAGTSFLKISDLGRLRYGAEIVNVVADARVKGGIGSFGYDDEGVRARRVYLIRDGILTGFQSSRETAPLIKRVSSGGMRADGWNRLPLIRMTNINLLPGKIPYEEMIAETKDGILMSTNRSWSIDDRRLNFQFGCEIAYRIQRGKITEVYKNPLYTGITPLFWSKCDAIGDKKSWRLIGILNCGKGEPGQTMRVGHGTAPARFRDVEIGAG
ncbi:TldD/PmbA family protein [candidate division WOR-3 bacterium]|uniref:TldD/PmbA family protein n=1 Tax=candidate division WOR-3 bacterium TaxID=2052148 RepID=A0A660SIC2_UNCW3|nr:MAG: TldD/PmbA family protein [candidate division WOR-3 bacterium]